MSSPKENPPKEYRPWLDNVTFAPKPFAPTGIDTAPPPKSPSSAPPPMQPPPSRRYSDRPWLEQMRLDSTPPTFREPSGYGYVAPSRMVWITPLRATIAAVFALVVVGCVFRFVHRTPSPIDSLDYTLPPTALAAGEPRVGTMRAEVDGENLSAGTASVVNYKTVTLVLTAYHLFGPAGGLSHTLDARGIAADVSLVHLDTNGAPVDAKKALYLAGAAAANGTHAENDLAAFIVEEGERAPTLAEALPETGEALTLVLSDGSRVAARVIEATPTHLSYELERAIGGGVDGAPLYDAHGAVAGVHVGMTTEAGKTRGSAIPAVAIRARLAKAIL